MSVNADKLVQIVPRVIDTGTPGLAFNGLFLTKSPLPPLGAVQRFGSAQAVAAYFGDASDEARLAARYFASYVNADYLPSAIFFAPYREEAVSAWVRGEAFTGTLANLKAVADGSMTISIDGAEHELTGINLSGATSYSDAAGIIQTALTPSPVAPSAGKLTGGVVTASPVAFHAVAAGELDIEIDGAPKKLTSLDFSGVSDVDDIAAVLHAALAGSATVTAENGALVITSATAGTSSSVSFAGNPGGGTQTHPTPATDLAGALALTALTGAKEIPGAAGGQPAGATVTYDSQTDAFQITSPTTGDASSVSYAADGATGTGLASLLGLTERAGAVQSAGRDAATPAGIMTAILERERAWVSFTTVWHADMDARLALANWQALYDTRFAYFEWDADPMDKVLNNGACFAARVNELQLDGVVPHYDTPDLAAAHMGLWASVNWDSDNGDIDPAFKQFEGLRITCNTDADYDALTGNGYNVYANFASASANFNFFQQARCSGKWDWIDQYMCAIAIKDALQLNLLDLFRMVKTLPYTESGFAQVRTACLDTITKFKEFGAIRPGVTLSQTQKVTLLSEIGTDVSKTIETQGWYMQVKDPGATVRGQRGTPDCRFYYTDGGSIHQIIMPSTLIQ